MRGLKVIYNSDKSNGSYPVRVNKKTVKIGCTTLNRTDILLIFKKNTRRGRIRCGCSLCSMNTKAGWATRGFKFAFRKNGDMTWLRYILVPASEIQKLKKLLGAK